MDALKVVHVTWIDSQATNEWNPIDEIKEPLKMTHSVGIFIGETENSLVLSLSYDPETDSANSYKHIPLLAIQKIRTLCRIRMKT